MTARVVVEADGSRSAHEAVRWAVREANARGAQLDVVFAWAIDDHDCPAISKLPPDRDRDRDRDRESAARAIADQLIERLCHDLDRTVNVILTKGRPIPVISAR